ncbi:TetR/AcrR family transcriptional regulator [Nocardia cyriacigeorgica]|uniref:TetR/AcrR family transcriptional regulator n=1 Tax=Nocardia cyriacigeorgica TaxID=135487 RepID=A0A6P1DCA3_9NOCA|nr:TetR family transcriptional regulator [Nocardia cyriacigeorgica]NEW41649.1 TetR/AcrR family transcriptional regulator [Nocardia cyriacigeorgica]NEW48127.1 TetR/AcrR family transcriptional regulator [Nocardia cyriacigeorgica]NEW59429.1 TetR/AcrR family transcriptional regulator [Nocardia cyriacigeorgica]
MSTAAPGDGTAGARGERKVARKSASTARTGRRPGHSGAKEAIIDAARARFAETGFGKTSIRAIAVDAGVDPALVHHYFGSKQQLFAAVIEMPIDPEVTLRAVDNAPLDQIGETIVRAVVSVWDSPAGAGVVAAVRSFLGGSGPSLTRAFLLEVVLERIRARIATPEDDGTLRMNLAASQMVGLLVARKIAMLEPMASMPLPQIVAVVGPTVQHYLTGELGNEDLAAPVVVQDSEN